LGLVFSLCLPLAGCGAESGDNKEARAEALSGDSYIVLYKAQAVPASAYAEIERAGGTLVAAYADIGVAIARSDSKTFAAELGKNAAVEGVSSTARMRVSALPTQLPTGKPPRPTPPPVAGDPLSGMQWNMDMIRAPQAHNITTGKKSVVVGVLDSGIDDVTIPDLQGQVDAARSVTCVDGVADTDPARWRNDFIGHGSHVAGIIGAKRNGKGVVGVAPGATLAAVKVTEDGFVYPEAFICGLNWAIEHDFDLVNASLFLDPWYYNCLSDPEQRATWIAVQRAVYRAMAHGITVFASTSNESQDLANPTVDPFSPTNGTPTEREIDNSCVFLPVEANGVIGTSALAGDRKLSYYSSYGLGVVDFTAPGGDLHVPMPGNASGQIVSTIPSYSFYYDQAIGWNGRVAVGCTDGLDPNDPNSDPSTCAETYALLQGTSAATPHATGVAALALSRYGDQGTVGVYLRLAQGAQPIACPPNPYEPYPGDAPPKTCEGPTFYNGFYGKGMVDALGTVQSRW
jgi:subtilisin family serine protease